MVKKLLLPAAFFLTTIVFFAACRPSRPNINYFSADVRDSSHTNILQSYEVKIQPGDKLSIYVTALNPESAKPYNISSGTGTAVTAQSQGINVDNQGRILYPQLGFIKAAGLTKDELRDTLLNRLKIYLTDPVVTVDYLNFRITVLGEVGKQGSIPVQDGSITILEAIGQAGDISITGKRDSVLVIRENAGKREFGYVNLLSNESFKSPYFALQQNDVIVVPMNKRKMKTEDEQVFTRNLSIVSSVVAILTSLSVLVLSLK